MMKLKVIMHDLGSNLIGRDGFDVMEGVAILNLGEEKLSSVIEGFNP